MFLKIIKNIVVFLALFYLTFYIPFVFTAYNPYWIKYNCASDGRCSKIKTDYTDQVINELTSFLSHRGELKTDWRENEKIHMAEVRDLFDIMFIAGIISLAVLLFVRTGKMRLYKFAIINIVLALALFIVIPNFKTFWRDIFHPLLFDNDFWRMTKQDVSYYITPRTFFKMTTIVILSTWMFLNALIIASSLLFRKEE